MTSARARNDIAYATSFDTTNAPRATGFDMIHAPVPSCFSPIIAPWLVVPDDHEVENNYANMVRADSSPALTAAQWTARRTAAYRAYYENMPLRPAQAPSGNAIPLYRRVRSSLAANSAWLRCRSLS